MGTTIIIFFILLDCSVLFTARSNMTADMFKNLKNLALKVEAQICINKVKKSKSQ